MSFNSIHFTVIGGLPLLPRAGSRSTICESTITYPRILSSHPRTVGKLSLDLVPNSSGAYARSCPPRGSRRRRGLRKGRPMAVRWVALQATHKPQAVLPSADVRRLSNHDVPNCRRVKDADSYSVCVLSYPLHTRRSHVRRPELVSHFQSH